MSCLSVLNVGGNDKRIALPSQYAGFEHVLLDVDPATSPDVLCDARNMTDLEPNQFDAVYSSHCLEHFYRHDVPRVLAGFNHVLKADGFIDIRVPDVLQVMREVVARGLDVDDVLYASPAGPILVADVLYGFSAQIARSGVDFFAHKIGFSVASLRKFIGQAGFQSLYTASGALEIRALGFKAQPKPEILNLFGVPPQPAAIAQG